MDWADLHRLGGTGPAALLYIEAEAGAGLGVHTAGSFPIQRVAPPGSPKHINFFKGLRKKSVKVKVLVTLSCPVLCNHMDCSPPGSSCLEFPRRGLPFPPPGDLPDPGTEPMSPALQAESITSEPPGNNQNPHRAEKVERRS